MIDGFLWGGFNLRKFYRMFFKNFWMVITVMIIAYLGLTLMDKRTYSPRYTSAAVAAVYPMTSSYRYHTIETAWDLSSKTNVISSMLNSDMFQSEFHNQYLDLQDCAIECMQVANTDLLVINATDGNPKNAIEGIRTALQYYSQFSGNMNGAPEIKIILGPEAPYLSDSSKIRAYRMRLCVFSGLMMAGLLLLMYVAKTTYKTERCIRKRYKNIRFFSLPFLSSGSENVKGIISKKNSEEPIKKLAIELKQVLHKCNKRTLLVTSYADNEGGVAVLSELARELAEQNEKVILIGTETGQHDSDLGLVSSDDIRRVLSDCLGYADIVIVNGTSLYPSRYVQMWYEAVDASIALCRQEDADFLNVESMLKDLQNSDTYFAGCVLFGF